MTSPALRFRFELTPLDDVAGWGTARDQVHWFGLSDGRYWIEGGHRVQPPGEVDYYVARFWEDALRLAAGLLHPVPENLVPLLLSDPDTWLDPDRDDVEAAVTWYDNHLLDFGYIRNPPRVVAWRTRSADVDEVTVSWSDCGSSGVHPLPVESTQVTVPTRVFRRAIEDFDAEFVQAMRERIQDVQQGRLPAGISIAPGDLVREHEVRTQGRGQILGQPCETDWDAVRAGARRLLGGR